MSKFETMTAPQALELIKKLEGQVKVIDDMLITSELGTLEETYNGDVGVALANLISCWCGMQEMKHKNMIKNLEGALEDAGVPKHFREAMKKMAND